MHAFWNVGRRALALNDSKTDDAQNPPCESQHPILALAPPDSPAPAWLKNVFQKADSHTFSREPNEEITNSRDWA